MREINPELMRQMEHAAKGIAGVLDKAMRDYYGNTGDKWGFGLFIFSLEGPEFTWISNANRADMVKTMQEFIQRNPPDQTSEQRN